MMTNPPNPRTFNSFDWISKSEAARLRGVSRQAIWELVNRRRLATFVFAGRVYLYRSDVLSFSRDTPSPAGAQDNIVRQAGRRKKKYYDPAKWISLSEAGRFMGISRYAVSDLVRRRRLRTLIVAGKMLVLRSGVEEFKRRQRKPNAEGKRAKKK